jgi:hypothetical protein
MPIEDEDVHERLHNICGGVMVEQRGGQDTSTCEGQTEKIRCFGSFKSFSIYRSGIDHGLRLT